MKNTFCWATKITRSPPSTTQIPCALENRRRRPRSTSSQKQFAFPPHFFEGPLASVPLWIPSWFVLMYCCWLLCCYRFGSIQFGCGCVSQEPCKGSVSASRKSLSGSGLGLRGVAHRRSEWSLRGCWFGFRSNHTPPNVDIPSCKGRELRESSPCLRVLHSRLPLSYSISYIV